MLIPQRARSDLSNNQLSGSVPSSLGSLTLLSFLDFGNNQLTGSIPASLANATSLAQMYERAHVARRTSLTVVRRLAAA